MLCLFCCCCCNILNKTVHPGFPCPPTPPSIASYVCIPGRQRSLNYLSTAYQVSDRPMIDNYHVIIEPFTKTYRAFTSPGPRGISKCLFKLSSLSY